MVEKMLSNILSNQPKVDICHSNGLIKPKPYQSKWGYLAIIPVIGAYALSSYWGVMVAKNFAEGLRELDLYEYVENIDNDDYD